MHKSGPESDHPLITGIVKRRLESVERGIAVSALPESAFIIVGSIKSRAIPGGGGEVRSKTGDICETGLQQFLSKNSTFFRIDLIAIYCKTIIQTS